MCKKYLNKTECLKYAIKRINKVIENIEHDTDTHKILDSGRYITEQELSKLLKVHKRTLIEYRHNGILPYYRIGHKIIYKESDIVLLFHKNYYSTEKANKY